VLCTSSRAKRVVVGLTLVALITRAIEEACWRGLTSHTVAVYLNSVVFRAVVPMAVLAINAIVVREVRRRASSDAASNLGVQHHQSTSSNSAVPTVLLVTTSLIYVLFNCTMSFSTMAYWALKVDVLFQFNAIAAQLLRLVYVYNFYVYLITGKQFRSQLHKLFCRCPSSSSAAARPTTTTNDTVRAARRGQADTAV